MKIKVEYLLNVDSSGWIPPTSRWICRSIEEDLTRKFEDEAHIQIIRGEVKVDEEESKQE